MAGTEKNAPSPYWRVQKWLVWLPAYVYGFIAIEATLAGALLWMAWKIRSGYTTLPAIDPAATAYVRFLTYLFVCCMALVGALIQAGIVIAWKIWRDTDEGNESLKRSACAQDEMRLRAEAAHADMARQIAATVARAEEQLRTATDTRASVERIVQGLEPKVLAVVEREMKHLPEEVFTSVKDNVAALLRPIVEEKLAEVVHAAMIDQKVQSYLESIGFIRTIATAVIQEAQRRQREASGRAGAKGGSNA